jgi:transcriptional regulator GlxA family with amidase domain
MKYNASSSRALSVGLVLVPGFTLLPFAGFVDTLRLAADDQDRSRQRLCRWQVMSVDGQSVISSCGVAVKPDSAFRDPSIFQYVVVVGGVLSAIPRDARKVAQYLQLAAASNVPLVGVCTGSFILARAGLMKGRTSCVSWFHFEEFVHEFPDHLVTSADQFLADGDRITCAGGTSAVHLASHLVDQHFGQGRASKGLRIMLEAGKRTPSTPQPSPTLLHTLIFENSCVRKALLLMEQRLDRRLVVNALARDLATTSRSLQRRFALSLGKTPSAAFTALRMDAVRQLVTGSDLPFCQIAAQLGFPNGSQLAHDFRRLFNESPTEARRNHGNARSVTLNDVS